MRETTGIGRPLGKQRGALAVVIQAKLLSLAGIVQAIEIGMDHGQAQSRRIVELDDGKAWAGHFAVMAKPGKDCARQRCLAGAKPAGQRYNVTSAQNSGDTAAKALHGGKIRKIDSHRHSVTIAAVPCPGSDSSSSVP